MFHLLILLGLSSPTVSHPSPAPMQIEPNFDAVSPIKPTPPATLKQRSKYPLTSLRVLEGAYRDRTNSLQVLVQGRVTVLLSDDVSGDRHQRFIVELANGQTLLIAHNIDLAPRVQPLREGDMLYIYGEYEWNERGGTIHWTHHDPDGSHVDGWVERDGIVFQ